MEEMSINPENNNKTPLSKRLISYAVKYLLPLALTVALVWYMFEKVDFYQMMDIIRQGVNYWWILLAMFISIFRKKKQEEQDDR